MPNCRLHTSSQGPDWLNVQKCPCSERFSLLTSSHYRLLGEGWVAGMTFPSNFLQLLVTLWIHVCNIWVGTDSDDPWSADTSLDTMETRGCGKYSQQFVDFCFSFIFTSLCFSIDLRTPFFWSFSFFGLESPAASDRSAWIFQRIWANLLRRFRHITTIPLGYGCPRLGKSYQGWGQGLGWSWVIQWSGCGLLHATFGCATKSAKGADGKLGLMSLMSWMVQVEWFLGEFELNWSLHCRTLDVQTFRRGSIRQSIFFAMSIPDGTLLRRDMR